MNTLIPNVSLLVFLGITVVLFGWAAFMTGQALASTWRPFWQVLPYGMLLGLGDRLLTFFLFQGTLISLPAYIFDSALLTGVACLSYRLTLVYNMVTQYPWLYERATLFSWRIKGGVSKQA
ncbi:MAG: hypothetical protein R3E60_04850 [Alphaproteobacteria bacterium]